MNYEREVMESAFRILSKKNFKWGYEFDDRMKEDLLNLLLTYFTVKVIGYVLLLLVEQ